AWVLIRSAPASPWHIVVLVLMPLYISRTFFNHAINGLEEPLSLLLLALFWQTMLRAPQRLYRLALLASLALCNRLDNAVLLLPGLGWLAWQCVRQRASLLRLAQATFPLWGWLGFSLLYYGFPFPNTKYAKLGTGVARADYIRQGLSYWQNLHYFDNYSRLLIIAGMLAGLAAAAVVLGLVGQQLRHRVPRPPMLMALGVLLHVLYVVRVGGDFMAARFFIAPFFQSLMLLYVLLHRLPGVLLLALAILNPILWNAQAQYLRTHPYSSPTHISDERNIPNNRMGHLLRAQTSLFSLRLSNVRTEHDRLRLQMRRNTYRPQNAPRRVTVAGRIGVWGFGTGPSLCGIDKFALSDALLARLPAHHGWFIGHFERYIPRGYIRARRKDDSSGMQSDLRQYYEKLRLVTSGDLFAPKRLRTIWGFMTGEYEPLRRRYIAHAITY
ncbi:MAG: hypothetical protein EBV03_10105, partial [Proteobacteria bacterium]|nr:hypothetical protein [Pseudomonadota bacterium]